MIFFNCINTNSTVERVIRLISINYKDRRPICEQLVSNISELAAKGLLPPGGQLPSVRQLALDLSINPNTIQKAYSALERDGIIVSVKGKGSFVSNDTGLLKSRQIEAINDYLRTLVVSSKKIGYPVDELLKKVREFYDGKEDSHD